MNKIRSLSLLIACVVTTACGSNTPGLDELKRLCEKDAGLTINKTVEVDGYYDASSKTGTLGHLVPSDYIFSEFCSFEPGESVLFDEVGCWRLIKVSRDTEKCNKAIDKILWRYGRKGYAEFRENNCIAVEKIEKPEAEYRYEVERKEWWLNESTGTKMTESIGRIIHNESGEVLAERRNYILDPKWSGTGRSYSYIHCGSAKATGQQQTKTFATGLIEKTLITRK